MLTSWLMCAPFSWSCQGVCKRAGPVSVTVEFLAKDERARAHAAVDVAGPANRVVWMREAGHGSHAPEQHRVCLKRTGSGRNEGEQAVHHLVSDA